MAEEESVASPLETAKAAVNELYSYRDHYFENFSIDRAKFKTEDVTQELTKCLEKLDGLKEVVDKASYCLERGRALNVLPTYSPQAQDLLARAVKLDPLLVDAWVHLGEVYWKNKDVDAAKNCFTGALNHSQDKVALRNLSMVLRQLGTTQEERVSLVKESVEKAKASVQLDLTDGMSWFILGNAYLSMFFMSGQAEAILQTCMRAYQQAEKDPVCKNNADLHFNRASAYKYQEDYLSALEGFSLAAALDPAWDEPPIREKQLLGYLTKISDMVNTKGKLRPKKLSSLLSTLKPSDLGPYAGGSYTAPRGQTVALTERGLGELAPGLNKETVVLGRVVCSLTTEEPVPFSFCFVDQTLTCYSVTVYNIVPGYGVKIGDSVAIPEPYVQDVHFTYNKQEFDFHNLRVDSPVMMVVNGRKQGIHTQAPTMLAVSAMSE